MSKPRSNRDRTEIGLEIAGTERLQMAPRLGAATGVRAGQVLDEGGARLGPSALDFQAGGAPEVRGVGDARAARQRGGVFLLGGGAAAQTRPQYLPAQQMKL